jgi:hypothetical protein
VSWIWLDGKRIDNAINAGSRPGLHVVMACKQLGQELHIRANRTQGAPKNKEEKADKKAGLDLTKEKAEVSTNELTA